MNRIVGLSTFVMLLAPALTACSTPPETIAGKVVSIADGDTLAILVGTTQHEIRLSGIDCPEKKQPFGARAKQFTSNATFGKTVSVEVVDRDRYGRDVGVVMLPDGSNLNHELVKAGLAWWSRKYAPKDKQLAALETAARKGRVGLWGDTEPITPWEWRAVQRAKDKPDRPAVRASSEYWLNTASGVRHNSDCRYFGKTKRGRPCGSNEGRACKICGG